MKKLLVLTLGLISGLALAGSIKKPWKVRSVHQDSTQSNTVLFPLVFHTGYDIGFMGLERLHPFDAKNMEGFIRIFIIKCPIKLLFILLKR